MLEKYVSRLDYSSYEDFVEGYRVSVPENFNFAYDVMDELARRTPDAPALVWCDEKGGEATFTYAQLKTWSDKTANFFAAAGIGKGDPVMLVLKRRYEFWFSILALHKLGAIAIPATHLLTTKDIVYRNKAADIKMIVTVGDAEVQARVDEAQPLSPTLVAKAALGVTREGWLDFSSGVEKASENLSGPAATEGAGTMTSCSCTSPRARRACPRWSGTTSPIRSATSSRRNTGRTSRRAASISPSPTRAGPRPSGARSTASGSRSARSSSTITTASCPRTC